MRFSFFAALGCCLFILFGCIEADITPDDSWYSEDKDYFVLSSTAKLYGFAFLVNKKRITFEGKTVALGANIQLANNKWEPIGNCSSMSMYVFHGTFDGQGYTLKGIDTTDPCAGFFGFVYGATIKNVTIWGTVTGKASGYSPAYAGGLAAKAGNGSVFKDCINACNVTASDTVGGIVGDYMGGAGIVAFENCFNNGTITGTGSSSYAGGIVGYNSGTIIIRNCGNIGNITSEKNAGGVTSTIHTNVENCYNAGKISSGSGSGVSGYYDDRCSSAIHANCYNSGLLEFTNLFTRRQVSVCAKYSYGSSLIEEDVGYQNCAKFDPSGNLLTTVGGYTTLLDALNGWIYGQANPQDYYEWTEGALIPAVLKIPVKITLYTMGGTLPDSEKTLIRYAYGPYGDLPVPSPPNKKKFFGWSKLAADFEKIVYSSSPVDVFVKMNLHAVYISAVNVTLDPNGGTVEPNRVELGVGEPYGDLPIPLRAGYYFNYWKLPDGKEVDDTTIVTIESDHSLTAQYSRYKYITFHFYNGTIVKSSGYRLNEKVGPLPISEREGYEFLGWFTASGVQITKDSIIEGNYDVYEHWSDPLSYNLAFDTQGGSPISTVSLTYNSTIPWEIFTTTQDGFFFVEWQLDGKPCSLERMPARSITVTALWNKVQTSSSSSSDEPFAISSSDEPFAISSSDEPFASSSSLEHPMSSSDEPSAGSSSIVHPVSSSSDEPPASSSSIENPMSSSSVIKPHVSSSHNEVTVSSSSTLAGLKYSLVLFIAFFFA